MAVRLKTEESRENNHQIDHNYFGPRPNLGANGGETLRIGTSHYSLTNSNTQVVDNYFDRCNGEHEIISNKSGMNVFKGNTFYECVGTLTFRHGNDNIAESNLFLGNGMPNTGGIRVINKRQKVFNNVGLSLTGHRFRGALVIMNGVPNSPINRYHQVDGAEVYNNTFINCDYVQLCAGSDAERSATPINTVVRDNVFWSPKKDDLFTVYDDVSGISFTNNVLSDNIEPFQKEGFVTYPADQSTAQSNDYKPVKASNAGIDDSFASVTLEEVGPSWYEKPAKKASFGFGKTINVESGADLFEIIEASSPGDVLNLSSGDYLLEKTIPLIHPITIKSNNDATVRFEKANLFAIENGGSLELKGIKIDGAECPDYAGNAVVRTSRYSMNQNYNLYISDCEFTDLDVNHSFNILEVFKNTFADSILIENTKISNLSGSVLSLNKETDDIGIYNAEFVVLRNNEFKEIGREVINLHRGGSDESTFGPLLTIDDCQFENVGFHKKNKSGKGLVLLGVQKAEISNSSFKNMKTIDIFHTVGEPITRIDNCKVDSKKLIQISDNTAKISNLIVEN